jgi:hypothetical protein
LPSNNPVCLNLFKLHELVFIWNWNILKFILESFCYCSHRHCTWTLVLTGI